MFYIKGYYTKLGHRNELHFKLNRKERKKGKKNTERKIFRKAIILNCRSLYIK